VKGKNPLDIQQKRITPTNTMLRATTGIVTTYMVDVIVVWVQLMIGIAPYSTRIHSHSILLPLSHAHQQSKGSF